MDRQDYNQLPTADQGSYFILIPDAQQQQEAKKKKKKDDRRGKYIAFCLALVISKRLIRKNVNYVPCRNIRNDAMLFKVVADYSSLSDYSCAGCGHCGLDEISSCRSREMGFLLQRDGY